MGLSIRAAAAVFFVAISLPIRVAHAQVPESELIVRIDQLERQIRQLTGAIEQLQFQNQQLEQQVRRMQESADGRQSEGAVGARPMPPRSNPIPPAAASTTPPPPPPSPGGRRPDVFDPAAHPNAPGAPRPLGPPGSRSDVFDPRYGEPPDAGVPVASAQGSAPGANEGVSEEPPVGIPGGRQADAPLDLSNLSNTASADPRLAPRPGIAPPPPPTTASTAPTLPPAQSPRDQFDLAYGYLLHKDYALADQSLRTFIEKYPRDPLVADARYWLAESLFERQNYREAAEAFLFMTKKYDKHPKAPDALLRLGQSLAALKERELACATFGEVSRKYPRASASVKRLTERERKRAHC